MVADLGLSSVQLAASKPEDLPLWPENVHAARVFEGMATQWRVGPAGPVGLVYESVPHVAQGARVSPRRLHAAWPGLRVMELEALAMFAEWRKQEASAR